MTKSLEKSAFPGASNNELMDALRWQRAVMDAAHEKGNDKAYQEAEEKARILKAELVKRKVL